MEEISPAILDMELTGFLLAAGLLQEDEIAPIIELPHQAVFGEKRRVSQR
jgi:hypothetical protein